MEQASWKALFERARPGTKVSVRVFERGGRPLLIVPLHGNAPPSCALALYAPQTLLARVAKVFWRWLFPLGFAPGSHVEFVEADASAPFMRFLTEHSGSGLVDERNPELPSIAILAGNPFAPAPKYLVQVFSREGTPVSVVKTGTGAAAAELINREADFLESVVALKTASGLLASPKVLGRFSHGHLTAFAMEYVEGESPRPQDAHKAGQILESWLDTSTRSKVNDIGLWKSLAIACRGDALFKRLESSLGEVEVCPAVFHGDFVPWNIKVTPGNCVWTVLDWERGEAEGLPGWDWFHYVLQSAMLVEKKTGPSLTQAAGRMLASKDLQAYLSRAGLKGREREWLLAYLLHCRDVLRPKEPAPGIDTLIKDFDPLSGF